jgi:hypothetical protein
VVPVLLCLSGHPLHEILPVYAANVTTTGKRTVLSRSLTSSTEDVAAVAELVRSHYTATGAILFSGVLLEVPIPTHWVLIIGRSSSGMPGCAPCQP